MTTTLIATWLLTYLLHSTILLCSALVVSRSMAGRNLAVQEMLLRAALIGGVLTATLQVGLGIAPLAGVFALDSAAQSQPAAVVSVSVATSSGCSARNEHRKPTSGLVLDWTTGLIVLWGAELDPGLPRGSSISPGSQAPVADEVLPTRRAPGRKPGQSHGAAEVGQAEHVQSDRGPLRNRHPTPRDLLSRASRRACA